MSTQDINLKSDWSRIYDSIIFYNYNIDTVLYKDINGNYPEIDCMIKHFTEREEYEKVIILLRLKP